MSNPLPAFPARPSAASVLSLMDKADAGLTRWQAMVRSEKLKLHRHEELIKGTRAMKNKTIEEQRAKLSNLQGERNRMIAKLTTLGCQLGITKQRVADMWKTYNAFKSTFGDVSSIGRVAKKLSARKRQLSISNTLRGTGTGISRGRYNAILSELSLSMDDLCEVEWSSGAVSLLIVCSDLDSFLGRMPCDHIIFEVSVKLGVDAGPKFAVLPTSWLRSHCRVVTSDTKFLVFDKIMLSTNIQLLYSEDLEEWNRENGFSSDSSMSRYADVVREGTRAALEGKFGTLHKSHADAKQTAQSTPFPDGEDIVCTGTDSLEERNKRGFENAIVLE